MTPIREWWPNTVGFVREVVAETKKVTWPDRKTVIATTVVVIVSTFIVGAYLWACDLAMSPFLNKILALLGA